MTFLGAIKTCFRKYVTFSGRATRPEYWYFVLFLFAGSIAAGALDGALFGMAQVEVAPGEFRAQSNGPLSLIFALVTFIPVISAGWRRMHDSGRSGLHLLYPLIVMVGIGSFFGFTFGIDTMDGSMFDNLEGLMLLLFAVSMIVLMLSPLIVIWWLARPSDPGPNRYGPHPNEVPS
jgi:uncharacterized membrane protein YhaH (DUF805 family)